MPPSIVDPESEPGTGMLQNQLRNAASKSMGAPRTTARSDLVAGTAAVALPGHKRKRSSQEPISAAQNGQASAPTTTAAASKAADPKMPQQAPPVPNQQGPSSPPKTHAALALARSRRSASPTSSKSQTSRSRSPVSRSSRRPSPRAAAPAPAPPKNKNRPVLTIPTIPSSIQLPPLPEIADQILARHAVTHVGYQGERKHPFEEPEDKYREDYEKLAMVGDAFLKDSLAVLIHKMYPRLAVGSFTVGSGGPQMWIKLTMRTMPGIQLLMSILLSNGILTQFSKKYGITRRVLTGSAAYATVVEQTVTGGAMFEAHIGALRYDGEDDGLPLHERSWKVSKVRDGAIRKYLETLYKPLVKWRYEEEKRLSQPDVMAFDGEEGAGEQPPSRGAEPTEEDNPFPPQPPVDPAFIPGAMGWLDGHIKRRGRWRPSLEVQHSSETAGTSHLAWHHAILRIVNRDTGEVVAEARATSRRLKDAKHEAAARIKHRVVEGELIL